MNTLLRRSFHHNNWSELDGFLAYLRAEKCFSNMARPEDKDANPYWWGSILEFNQFDSIIASLLSSRSLKRARLKRLAKEASEDNLSPIVRLVGLTLLRRLEGGLK